MTAKQTAGARARARAHKTWSAFGEDLRRRPSEYEFLTHNMLHSTGARATVLDIAREAPLEMGSEVRLNRWYKQHRDSMALRVDDWDGFRDPDALTYFSYVAMQDEQEVYVDGLLEHFDGEGYDEALSEEAITLLKRALTPTIYVANSQQMLSSYVEQLALSTYVGNCAVFQTADQLRRVQLQAYRTTQLCLTYPDRGFGTGEKTDWTEHPDWQPIRAAFECALVEFDWDRAFVVTNLVTKAIADQLFLVQLGHQLVKLDAQLDAQILDNLWRDAQRSRRWSTALVEFVRAADEDNLAVLQRPLDDWNERAQRAIDAGARLIATPAGEDAATIAAAVREDWLGWLSSLGLQPGQQ
ncbi:MAG: toluene hydroxylase [Mycobacterium sp.]